VKKVWIEYTWQKFGPSIHGKSLDRVYMAKVWTEYTWQKFGQNIWGKCLDRVYNAKVWTEYTMSFSGWLVTASWSPVVGSKHGDVTGQ
jgi:hypothetical protein